MSNGKGRGAGRPWLLSDRRGENHEFLPFFFFCRVDTLNILFLRTDVRSPGAGRWAAEGDVGMVRIKILWEV